jgi:hypothetical protein
LDQSPRDRIALAGDIDNQRCEPRDFSGLERPPVNMRDEVRRGREVPKPQDCVKQIGWFGTAIRRLRDSPQRLAREIEPTAFIAQNIAPTTGTGRLTCAVPAPGQ